MPGGEEMRGNIALSFNHPIKERNMTLYGEKGTLTYDMMSRPPLVLAGYRVDRGHSRDAIDKQVTSFDFDEFNTVEEVVKGFYDVLAGDAPDNIDLSVGVTKAMERITSGTS
jgi:predicted dehydrogenase